MSCDTYRILYRGNIIARGMPLETALILLKALFQECWGDMLAIEKEPMSVCEGEQE